MISLIENFKNSIKQADKNIEKNIARLLFNASLTVSTAESCTGGLVSSRLTDIPGSSFYTKENFVTYSNEAKIKHLGVKEETLNNFGAVSEQCALEMARGVFERTGSNIGLATTGIAGPTGATGDKKIGLMYVAIKNQYKETVKKIQLDSSFNRKTMKFMFSQAALEALFDFLNEII